MSLLVELSAIIVEQLGWNFLFFAFFAYQLYMPEQIHPKGGTKLQRLLKAPHPSVVTSLEAIAEEVEELDEYKVKTLFNDGVQTDDLKDPNELRKGK